MGMSPRLLRPRASGGFSPKNIAGLQLWLDAADSSTITTGTGVSEWRDKSATGSKWEQTTGNNQPATGTQTLNGRNVLVFDGSNDSLSASAPLASLPLSFFIVQRIVSATNFGMSYTAGTADNFNIRQNGTSGILSITMPSGLFYQDSVGSRVGIDDIVSMVIPSGASASGTLFRNGSSLTPSNATYKPTLTGTHYIGQRADGFYLNGWIAEIIAYSTELSASQRSSVEAYLAKKWGIALA